jgi:diadenosine tetraphosphate (Ap4A) HIT family hydrolase
MSFALHPQLAADTAIIGELPLCRVLLMDNANFPWLILVPKRAHLRELFDLEPEDYTQAMQEIRMVSEHFCKLTGADKMNVAALGNMVPQLHIHIIARFKEDAMWPSPVWSCNLSPKSYDDATKSALIARLKKDLRLD